MKIYATHFVQKLEQNDQKCVYFYTLANICEMGKNMISERVGKNMILYEQVIYRTPAIHAGIPLI